MYVKALAREVLYKICCFLYRIMSVSTPVDGVAKIKPMFLVTATTIAQENCSYPNQRQLTTLACDREPADASASSPKKARNDDVGDRKSVV